MCVCEMGVWARCTRCKFHKCYLNNLFFGGGGCLDSSVSLVLDAVAALLKAEYFCLFRIFLHYIQKATDHVVVGVHVKTIVGI